MKQKSRLALTFGILCGIMLFVYRSCNNPVVAQLKGVTKIEGPTKIRQSGNARNVARPLPLSDQTVPYVPAEGYIEIIPGQGWKDDPASLFQPYEIRVKTHGFTFRPGVQITLPFGLGLDAKVYYWNRFGLNLGAVNAITSPTKFDPRASATVSYRLDQLPGIMNLEVFVGGFKGWKDQGPMGGLRINL